MRRKWMAGAIAAALFSLGGCASFGPGMNGAQPGMMAGGCPMMAQGGCGMHRGMGMQGGCPMAGAMGGGMMGHGKMDGQGMGPGMMGGPNRQGMGPGMMGGGGLRDYAALDLTDEQRAKMAEIRSGLRQQMVQAREEAQKRMDAVLTEEQRAKLRRGG